VRGTRARDGRRLRSVPCSLFNRAQVTRPSLCFFHLLSELLQASGSLARDTSPLFSLFLSVVSLHLCFGFAAPLKQIQAARRRRRHSVYLAFRDFLPLSPAMAGSFDGRNPTRGVGQVSKRISFSSCPARASRDYL
jgi:hypothetical protein